MKNFSRHSILCKFKEKQIEIPLTNHRQTRVNLGLSFCIYIILQCSLNQDYANHLSTARLLRNCSIITYQGTKQKLYKTYINSNVSEFRHFCTFTDVFVIEFWSVFLYGHILESPVANGF